MKNYILIYFVIFAYILSACNSAFNPDEEIICNTMFVAIGVEIKGAKLDTFYTVRQSNKDTISDNFVGMMEGSYTLVSDRYLDELRNSQDTFHFIGIINDSVVVREPYIIGADACHIYKVSGKETINLGK